MQNYGKYVTERGRLSLLRGTPDLRLEMAPHSARYFTASDLVRGGKITRRNAKPFLGVSQAFLVCFITLADFPDVMFNIGIRRFTTEWRVHSLFPAARNVGGAIDLVIWASPGCKWGAGLNLTLMK